MIEVGEYVRTKNGKITKLIKLGKHCVTVGHGMQEFQEYCRFKNSHYINANNYEELCKKINKYIIKHSKNIIDLIEVGDYVNGYPVRRIPNFNNELCNFDLNTMEWKPLKDIDVYYNILTKEQYQANCYTVERKEEC